MVNGAYAISAPARDAAGNQTTSVAVGVTVSNAVPTRLVAAFRPQRRHRHHVGKLEWQRPCIVTRVC